MSLTRYLSFIVQCVRMLSDGCRMLETLNLSWCDQITRDGIEALARGCAGLRALFLRGCTQVRTFIFFISGYFMPSLALLKVVLHLFIINYHIITKKPT